MTAMNETLTVTSLAGVAAVSEQLAGWGAETFASGGFPRREMDALRRAGLYTVTLPGRFLDGNGAEYPTACCNSLNWWGAVT